VGLSRDELIDVIAACDWSVADLDDAIHQARVRADLRGYADLSDAAEDMSKEASAALARATEHSAAGRPADAIAAMAEYHRLADKRDRLDARAQAAHKRAMRRMDERHAQREAAQS
jgi:hypothetical protein